MCICIILSAGANFPSHCALLNNVYQVFYIYSKYFTYIAMFDDDHDQLDVFRLGCIH